MATWHVYWSEDHLALDYRRPGTLGVFRCGTLHRFTDLRLVVAWVVEQEATAPGDLVLLPDGDALQIQAQPPGKV